MKALQIISAILALFLCASAWAKPTIGAPAPLFELPGSEGEQVKLADLKGKTVILEWTNHKCPFVRKHYKSDNMQALQRRYSEDENIVWLTIISSAPGKQGYVEADKAKALTEKRNAAPDHVLLDPSGQVGRQYLAKTTPHMYIIDPQGILQYMGAIDSIRSADPADVSKAENYITRAMAELQANKPVSLPLTPPYGCTVKYSS